MIIRARKRFGQHFLHDPGVIARIVAAIDPRPGERIVEIGPGLGALTGPLLERSGRVEVVEIDRDVIPELERRTAGRGELVIHNMDVLETDFRALRGTGAPLRVCGNLPYNISTPLLFHLLAAGDAVQDMHFMLQKEVVERMAAVPGSKVYGRLSVMLQLACTVEPLLDVPPEAFRPPPKVDSAVVRLLPRPPGERPLAEQATIARLVRAAFGQRRKTLSNALDGVATIAEMQAAGIDPRTRAEQVAPQAYVDLARHIDHARGQPA